MSQEIEEKEFITGSRERNARPAYDQAVTEGMIPPSMTLKEFRQKSDHYEIMQPRIGSFFPVNIPDKKTA